MAELSALLCMDLDHIQGERVVRGDMHDTVNLLEILATLCRGAPLLGEGEGLQV